MRKSKLWAHAGLLLLLLVVSLAAIAQAPVRAYELRVLTADDSAVTREIVQALKKRHPALQTHSDAKVLGSRKGPAIYITLGPSALRAALTADLDSPIVSLFTSSQAYVELSSRTRMKRSPSTAIYAEAAPAHQLQLIARLFGRRVTVGVLITENTAHLVEPLRSAARETNLDLEIQSVSKGENPLRSLNRLGQSAALLAFPDSAIYTAASLRDILESTYRRNLPVIGFSSATVTAGTMASAYSTIDDVLAQLDEILNAAAAGRLPEPQFPRYWRVAVNESVARSLNVIGHDEIRALGVRPPETSR